MLEGATALSVMVHQEASSYRVPVDYIHNHPRRRFLVQGCTAIVNKFDLSPETIAITFNLYDRYMASDALIEAYPRTNRTMDLAAMTCLHISIKAHEPEWKHPRSLWFLLQHSKYSMRVAEITRME